tara:strand:- start:84 stop:233 length:150 start_codon:yes stop_codon:yes gene_type:complete
VGLIFEEELRPVKGSKSFPDTSGHSEGGPWERVGILKRVYGKLLKQDVR